MAPITKVTKNIIAHQCGSYGTLNPKARYSQKEQAQVLKAYQERTSMRGIRRIFGVVPQTLLRWIKAALEKLPSLTQTLAPARADDVLELDELWSFVLKKSNKRWIWIALCRRTRQVIAYYVGDRSEESCRQLWQCLPAAYNLNLGQNSGNELAKKRGDEPNYG